MWLDQELFATHVEVPFVPTLGPVHPSSLTAAISDMVESVESSERLPYDKMIRWSNRKSELILTRMVLQDELCTIVPTRDCATDKIKLYCYSPGDAEIVRLARQVLSRVEGKGDAQFFVFDSEPTDAARGSIVFLAELSKLQASDSKADDMKIVRLEEISCQMVDTIKHLEDGDPDNAGFSFLHDRVVHGYSDGEVLVCCDGERIIGAVGPLRVVKDATGRLTRFPVYFGVSSRRRRKRIGSELWKAAIKWAAAHGVLYFVLQARAGSPAEFFYRKMKLQALGSVTRIDAR